MELAKATGNYVDGHIECVTVDRRTINASLVLPFGTLTGPSAAWLQKYKEEFFVLLDKHNDHYYCVGFTPLWEQLTDKEDFPGTQVIKRSEKFIIKVSDPDDSFRLEKRDESITFVLDNDGVFLDTTHHVTVKNQKHSVVMTEEDLTIKNDKYTIKMTGTEMTIEGPNIKLFGNTKLEVQPKNVLATGAGPFCALPLCVFSGAPHVGNEAK